MAKEKVFRSGKKKRKKKERLLVPEKKESHWKQWGKRHSRKRRRELENQALELKEAQSSSAVVVTHKTKKKKKKITSDEEYIAWNRARQTGLTRGELHVVTATTETTFYKLVEINLTVDHVKVAEKKKLKHNINLSNLLSKLP